MLFYVIAFILGVNLGFLLGVWFRSAEGDGERWHVE